MIKDFTVDSVQCHSFVESDAEQGLTLVTLVAQKDGTYKSYREYVSDAATLKTEFAALDSAKVGIKKALAEQSPGNLQIDGKAE